MLGFNGGLIGKRRQTSLLGASGLYLPNEQSVSKRDDKWPLSLNLGDPFGGGFFAGYYSGTANGIATHALIVAPQSTGASGLGYPVTTQYAWKNATNVTLGTFGEYDGQNNTRLMEVFGITNHAAGQFCRNLSIGGFTDWYLPSKFELEIAYLNLKPTTTSNNTNWGINPYSVPQRTGNYTTGDPARTSLADFQSGGSQAFSTASNSVHMTSTQTSAFNYRIMQFTNGQNFDQSKTTTAGTCLRAFRRVAV